MEIERELLSCNLGIQDVAVVGIPDPEWGQKVAAVVVLESGKVVCNVGCFIVRNCTDMLPMKLGSRPGYHEKCHEEAGGSL